MLVRYGEIVGVPFLWNGRDPGEGLDCAGVMLWYFEQLGIKVDDPIAEYSAGWLERGENHVVSRYSSPWFEAPLPWRDHDLALLRWPPGADVSHVGVIVGNGQKILHAHGTQKVVCSPLPAMRRMIWAVARHEDLR